MDGGGGGHFYCLVCMSNLRDGPGARKRHTAGEAHGRALTAFLEEFTAEVRKRHREMRHVTLRADTLDGSAALEAHEWHCSLCGMGIDTRRSPYAGHAVYQHLAGKKHSLAVDDFVVTYLSAKHRQRYKRKHLRITQGAFQKYKEREKAHVLLVPRVLLDRRAFPDCVPFPAVNVGQGTADKTESAGGPQLHIAVPETEVTSTTVPPPASATVASPPPRSKAPPMPSVVPRRAEQLQQQLDDLFTGVREEIKARVAAANRISQRKKGLKEIRHKRTNDEPIPSHRYLPNFGGVWVSGPRSQTRAHFKLRKLH